MSTGSVEVVYRGIFQKTLAKNICRGIVLAARKEGKIGTAILIDEVEQDGGLNISQTSLTIARDNGFTLGAVTIGINVDALK